MPYRRKPAARGRRKAAPKARKPYGGDSYYSRAASTASKAMTLAAAARMVSNAYGAAGSPGSDLVGMGARAAARYAGAGLMTGAGYAAELAQYISGHGDYKISSNSLMNMGTKVPQFRNGQRCTIVRHREYIGDISSSIAFAASPFVINPGQAATFPWLSTLASNYEEYKFHGLVFQFKSTSADALNSTNTAMGTVICATQYNSLNTVFTSKQQMENYEFAVSGKPSQDLLAPVECARGDNPLSTQFIRTGAIQSGSDERFYDLGDFTIATSGSQAAAVIGELWVTYEVELIKPKLAISASLSLSAHWAIAAGVVAGSAVFGTLIPAAQTGSNLSASLTSAGLVTLTNAVIGDVYSVMYSVVGASTVLTSAPGYGTLVGCTAQVNLVIDTATGISTTAGATMTRSFLLFTILVTANSPSFIISTGTVPGTQTSGELFIWEQIATLVT